MRFLKEMYLSEGIRNEKMLRWKLKHGAGVTDLYVISISAGKNQLDCIHGSYFKQKAIRENTGLIVGFAKGYSKAQELIISMIEETVRETGGADVKNYLLSEKAKGQKQETEHKKI